MILALAVWLAAIGPSLALLHFTLEVCLGLRRLPAPPSERRAAKVAVIVPAHDEAPIIAGTVASLRGRVAPTTLVLVVADNCTDDTAARARTAGATVIERTDPRQRGKGFALAYARDFLSADPPAAVVVVDADCMLAEGSVEGIASYALERGEPAQSVNLLSAPPIASPLVQLSNFAMTVKNLVRARGLYRLGGGIPLFGTGMAFPWAVFCRLPLATADTVEDLALALSLAAVGTRVHLYEHTMVISGAARLEDSLGQRRRWEHGFLTNALRHGMPLLWRGARDRCRHLLFLGAHLLVPPLALLFLAAGLCLVVAVALAGWTGYGPALLLAAAISIAILAAAIAWWQEGRRDIGLRGLMRAPLYVIWKLPVYIGFFSSRQADWNRTRRADEET